VAIDLCESCLRKLSNQDPERELEERKELARSGIRRAARYEKLVELDPRWRVLSRWKTKRRARELRQEAMDYLEHLEKTGRQAVADEIGEFKELVALIDERLSTLGS
jgi:hypothetical protein